MAERAVVEYLANCAWQIPLLALGAWVLLKVVRPGVRGEHWLWLSVLALSVVLPACGIRPYTMVTVVRTHESAPEPLLSSHTSSQPSLQPGSLALVLPGVLTRASTVSLADGSSKVQERRPALLRSLQLSVAVRRWLLALYGAPMMLAGLRFVRAWLSARRLVRESRELALPADALRQLAECGARLRVILPAVRETSAIAGPVIVGAIRPALLLPERFADHAENEIRAALLHELAHVRRRDYLVNLVCQLAALPVAWHPATRAIQRRIRLTREMVCDEMAAEQMISGASYAQCLVALARQMLGADTQTQALGLFEKATTGTMEERVMRLTERAATGSMSARAKALRTAVGAAAMLAVVSATLTFHLTPTFAATAAETVTIETDIQTGSAIVPVATPAAVVAPASVAKSTAAPAAFQATLSDVKLVPAVEPVPQEKAAGVSSQANPGDDWPTAVAGKGGYVHRWIGTDGKKYVTANRDPKEPTAEERLEIERNLNVSQKDLDEMKLDLSGLRIDLASPELKVEIDEATRLANDPKMKQEFREIEKQAAEIAKDVQINLLKGPEWQKQMAEMQKTLNGPAWQKQMAELEKNAQLNMLNSPEWKKQMDDMQKSIADMTAEMQLKTPKSQLSNPQSQLQVNAQIEPQIKDALAKAQKELESGEMKAKLDAAQKTLDEVRRQMEELQKK